MIGVLGGAGPLAGIELFRQIINETKASRDQEHLPVILGSFPEQIPDRTEFLEGKIDENPAYGISQGILKLERAGVTIAGISCNTAHDSLIFNKIQELLANSNSNLEVLNMVSESLKFLETNFSKDITVGILSTTGTWKNKIYSDRLEQQGYTVLVPKSAEEQHKIHLAVYDKEYGVKASGTQTSTKAKDVLYGAANKLIQRGAEVIILACTEIPLVITDTSLSGIYIVNTIKVFARSLIGHYSPKKLKALHLSYE